MSELNRRTKSISIPIQSFFSLSISASVTGKGIIEIFDVTVPASPEVDRMGG